MKKFLRTITPVVFGLAVAGLVLVAGSSQARAASNERMMDDAVFDNSGSMSASDIQNFLNQFPNSCLKNYSDEYPNDYFSYGGAVSAATVIRRASDLWGINPRVLLGKLEQEENLVTGNSGCNLYQYVSAVGYDCPGSIRTAVFRGTTLQTCVQHDAAMGFSRQITKGAWVLKFAKERANDNLNWLVPDDGNVQYYGVFTNAGMHKRCASCAPIYHDGYFNGVDVQTGATASFYNYTPFLNQAFDEIYEGWFGSTYAAPWRWQFVSQGSNKDLSQLKYGDTVTVAFTARNIGSQTWTKNGPNQINVVTDRPLLRSSSFYDSSWVNNVTPARMNEDSVAPNQNGTFTFNLKIPNKEGSFREYFSLVAQGAAFFNTDQGQYFQLNVSNPYKWSYNSQAAYTDSSKTTPVDLGNMSPGQTAWLVVKANNTGGSTWQRDGVNQTNLATDRPLIRSSRFATAGWLNPVTPAKLVETSVVPGQVGTFEFPIQIPSGAGSWREYFNPVAQGITFFNNDPGQFFQISVKQDYKWSYNSQAAYTDSSKTTPVDLGNMSPGQTAWLVVKANNTGGSTWLRDGNYQVNLATDNLPARSSQFSTSAWLNAVTPAKMNEITVSPGQTATFEFPIKAPNTIGNFREYFNPLAQTITWFNNNVGQFFPIVVR